MSRSAWSTPSDGASGSRRRSRSSSKKRLRKVDSDKDGGRDSGSRIEGKHIPLTPTPSVQNIPAMFYNALPASLRNMLPIGTEPGGSDGADTAAPPKDKRGVASWQDVCFIHSIPGDDEEEGVVVLSDGSFRKYIMCKGINVLLFDDADRDQMARPISSMPVKATFRSSSSPSISLWTSTCRVIRSISRATTSI